MSLHPNKEQILESPPFSALTPTFKTSAMFDRRPSIAAVVIGASAGALEALSRVLPSLPENYPIPLIVVVHIPPDYPSLLAELLNAKCKLDVSEAEDKEQIKAGHIYFAPANYHLLVESDYQLSLSTEGPVCFSRPSIDVLFQTAADAYQSSLCGILLTGANCDGAAGIQYILKKGGLAYVQNPHTAQSSMMPRSALDLCPEANSLSLEQITAALLELGKKRQ